MKKVLVVFTIIFLLASCNSKKADSADQSSTMENPVAVKYQEISALEAADLIEAEDPVIIDVRTEEEYNEGHISGALLYPVQTLEMNLAELEQYKDKTVFVYCRSGNRSTTASQILLDNGFNHIFNLETGIRGWISQGLPLEK